MTCQDCKWLEKAKDNKKSAYVGRCVCINRLIAKEYEEHIRALLCKYFEPISKDRVYDMRPPTKEERESVNKYIDSISVETGITIEDCFLNKKA